MCTDEIRGMLDDIGRAEKADDDLMDRVYDDPDSVVHHLRHDSECAVSDFMDETANYKCRDGVLRGADVKLPHRLVWPIPYVPPLPPYNHITCLNMPFWHGTNGLDREGQYQSVTLAVEVNGLLMLYLRGVDQVLPISRMSIAAYNSDICQIVLYSGATPTCAECSITVSHLDHDLIALCAFLKSNHAINNGNMWTWPVVFNYASFPAIDISWVLDTVNYDRPCLRWGVAKPRPVLSFVVGDTFYELCPINMKLMDEQDMVSLSVPVAVAEYMISISTFGKQGDFVCKHTNPNRLAYTTDGTDSHIPLEFGPSVVAKLEEMFA